MDIALLFDVGHHLCGNKPHSSLAFLDKARQTVDGVIANGDGPSTDGVALKRIASSQHHY